MNTDLFEPLTKTITIPSALLPTIRVGGKYALNPTTLRPDAYFV
jgi:hypothetical protein